MITVLRAGPLTTVQDLGRPGFAHLGVPRSGALDEPALRRANALVGNDPSAAGLETTLMGCRLRFDTPTVIAITGAACTVKVDGQVVGVVTLQAAWEGVGPLSVAAGSVVEIGRATAGVRSYVAVAGGVDVEPVLGSRSTDTLSGLGPRRLIDGQQLPVLPLPDIGGQSGGVSSSERVGQSDRRLGGGLGRTEIVLGVWVGPRAEWVEMAGLFEDAYEISPMSNRVACRLAGTGLPRSQVGELPPEGLVLGAIQVPPDGQPLIFLADHPTTGGYPVIGVVDDVAALAQGRPGTSVRFRELD
jgi:biotin-dependent carboxylase-like uncharacterized protein